MLTPERLWFLGECLEDRKTTILRHRTSMVTLYSELLHDVLGATAQWLSEEVQIITVASTLKVNSCIVFISDVTVDEKKTLHAKAIGRLDIEAYFMAISTTTMKWVMSNWAVKVV
jgi:hypothetical protein